VNPLLFFETKRDGQAKRLGNIDLHFNVFIKVLRKRQARQKAKGQKMIPGIVCPVVMIAALLLVVNTQKRPNEIKILFYIIFAYYNT